ncbi:hypothetical protein BDV06DRAFT_196945 [Aspergillus oleicola]
MNNEQFRRLLINNNQPSSKPKSASPVGASQSPPASHNQNAPLPQGGSGGGGGGNGHLLGSRMRSSIPMTPRTLHAPNFAAQLSEYRRDYGGAPPNKKFKSSAAPKGTKLPAGYEDRTAARLQEGEGSSSSENEAKLKELEEKLKKGLIDDGTFTRLRKELGVGGDLGSTHMVKGLDWDLLRRIRAGEDVEKEGEKEEEEGERDAAVEAEGEEAEVDVDEEFDKVLEGKSDEALPSAPREKEKKKGSMAPPPAPAQRKTRDEILKELKASRAAASGAAAPAPQPEPALGARFKKIGDSNVEKKRFIEQDENGRRREVLLITDAEGKTKRKTRLLDPPGTKAPIADAAPSAPAKEAKPLGMEVPAEIAAKIKAAQKVDEEDEDDDIFAGVGADYDPLGDAGSDENSSDSEGEEGEVAAKPKAPQEPTDKKDPTDEPRVSKPRNYFATSTTGQEEHLESNRDRVNPLTKDPTLLAALKRAAALRQAGSADDDALGADEEGVDQETLLRRKKFLEEARRREALDAADMDYGFGGSRIEDDEDEEAVLLEPRGGNKRKRGPKKKKGDKDSASDVLGVLEGRKKDA